MKRARCSQTYLNDCGSRPTSIAAGEAQVGNQTFPDRVKKMAKAAVVRISNLKLIDQYILSYTRLPFRFLETSVRGYWNALLVQQRSAPPNTLMIAKVVSREPGDPERFLAQLAVTIAKNPNCKEIDLLLVGHDDCPVTVYSAIARMFGRRLNFQLFWNAQALSDVAKTLTAASVLTLDDIYQSSRDAVVLTSATVGTLLPPPLSKNIAREYLKTINPSGYFCAITLRYDAPTSESISALTRAVECYSDWHFVVLNDASYFDSQELPLKVHLPSRAGFDVLTRLCIAAEVDAFVGVDDIYGLTTSISGKPAHLSMHAGSCSGVSLALSNVHCSAEFSRNDLPQYVDRVLSRLREKSPVDTNVA
jgi:hypothetical protein